MKKILVLLCALTLAQPAMAANISTLGALNQTEFRILSEDLGAALSYKPITPAESLGVTGFEMGIGVTQTDTAKSAQIWNTATNGGGSVSKLYMPKLHIAKGLPFGIDLAAVYSRIPGSNISLLGAEIRYAIVDGGTATPAIAIRGAHTKLSGVDQLALNTNSIDLSISKGFAMFTPYAGVGRVWVTSTPNGTSLSEEKFTQSKIFVGGNLNFGLTNFAAELDKTGGIQSISLKLGSRF